MKRAFLIPVGLVVLFTTAAAFAAAPATFVFNTSAFDFTNTALTEGYIGFSLSGDQVLVTLSSAGAISKIPGIEVAVPAATTNAVGTTEYPTLANLSDVTVTSAGAQDTGFTVTHADVGLDAVVSAYVNAFTNLGFTSTEVSSAKVGRDLQVFTFSKGGLDLRAVFHRDGTNVTAHLSGAAAV